MQKYSKLLLVCLVLFFSYCSKKTIEDGCPYHDDTSTLPPATQCAANTFGCLVNGEVWVADVEPYVPHIYAVHSNYSENGFIVRGAIRLAVDNSTYKYQYIKVNIREDISQGGIYTISDNGIDENEGTYIDFISGEEFITFSNNSGELEITKFDREEFIISGTFWFTAVNGKGDTIRVTDGRFDVRE